MRIFDNARRTAPDVRRTSSGALRAVSMVSIITTTMFAAVASTMPAGAGSVAPVYELSVYAGHNVTTGWPGAPHYATPQDVAIDKSGNLYIADGNNAQVEEITAQGVFSVIAGTGDRGTTTAGPATSTDLKDPVGVAVDASGNVYISDETESQIYEVTPGGNLSIIAGTGSTGAPTPGPATSSNLWYPAGVAVDSHGNVYIADTYNNVVEKVTPSVNSQPGTLSIFAGNGNINAAPSPGPATNSDLFTPWGLAVDAANNLYIAAELDNRILKVTPTGTLSIIAGNGTRGTPTNGAATSSALDEPESIAVDSSGSVYVGDMGDGVISKITGSALAIIGGNGKLADPTPGLATQSGFDNPSGVAVDSHGNVLVANVKTSSNDNDSADASAIDELSVLAPPAPPTAVSATAGNAQATVSFVPPTSTGGGPISNYTVTAHDATNAARGGQTVSGTASPLTLNHLTNGDSYTFTVTSTSPGGTSIASSASRAVIPSTTPSTPFLTSAASRYKGVKLSWNAPASTGGIAITSYQIFQGSTPGGESVTPVAVVSGTATSADITGLNAWSTYYFTIKAVNADGSSPTSLERSAVACSDQLTSPQTNLATFQELVSSNNEYFAVLQGDGNFVVTSMSTGAVLFQSKTIGAQKGHLLTLSAGKLKLINAAGTVVWTPKAAKGTAATLQLTNNGSLVLLTAAKTVLWTGTAANSGG